MGGATSRAASSSNAEAAEIKSLEARFATLGLLPHIQTVSNHLAGSPNSSIPPSALQELFELKTQFVGCTPKSDLHSLKESVASALVNVMFEADSNGINWTQFLKGFEKYCQPTASLKLNLLVCYYYHVRKSAQLPVSFSLTNKAESSLDLHEFEGHMSLDQLQDFFWLCWLFGHDADTNCQENFPIQLPDVEPLVKAASMECSENDDKSKLEQEEVDVGKLLKWLIISVPGLGDCLSGYIQAHIYKASSKFQSQTVDQRTGRESCEANVDTGKCTDPTDHSSERGLLTSGVAWAIGLSQQDAIGCRLMAFSYKFDMDAVSILYRSSIHGRGMNRFWTRVEGYRGAVLILIYGLTMENTEDNAAEHGEENRWLVGCLVKEGFENRNSYRSSGSCLYALKPIMKALRSTGHASNDVYSYSHVAGTAYHYQQIKRPEGIGFGGDYGKERLWIDKDFMETTMRHHVIDKTYQPGHLVPNQDYKPVKGKVLEVEVWGLGGKATIEEQAKFQQRENLFAEQKRKVDLQSFGNWADSPEKMMMDLVSDPKKVQHEER